MKPAQQVEQAAYSAEALEVRAREAIADWWRRADRPPCYPATSADVVALLAGVEYEVTDATVHEFIDEGWILMPVRRGGKFQWTAMDVCKFAAALEQRRRWQKFSRLHVAKKSGFQRGREIAEAQGISGGVCKDLERYTFEDLLLLLVEFDDRQLREAVYTAYQCKLEQSAA